LFHSNMVFFAKISIQRLLAIKKSLLTEIYMHSKLPGLSAKIHTFASAKATYEA